MGPGLLIKALLQGSFSLLVFGWAQIVMDLQPLLVLLTGEGHLHGFSHTLLGASLLAVVAALSGRYLAGLGLWALSQGQTVPLSWRVTFISAFIGTYSHVLLDALMHADLAPFAPFSLVNPWLSLLSVTQVHWFCLIAGLIGITLWPLMAYWLGKRTR